MKFLEKFVRTNLKIDNSKSYIAKDAIEFLVDRPLTVQVKVFNNREFVNITDLSSEIKSKLGLTDNLEYHPQRILYRAFRSDPVYGNYLKEELASEFCKELKDLGKYVWDFRSYNFSIEDATRKAITLCLMKVIKYFLQEYNNPQMIYEVLKNFETRGAIPMDSAKHFYDYTRRLIRSGIYQGVLLDKLI